MRIEVDDLTRPAIHALLHEHLANMHALSPPEQVFALDLSRLRSPDITFWTVWDDDVLLGCGALKELTPTHGEIKSMRTPARLRGKGAGRAVLQRIISTARERNYTLLSLETGTHPAFVPAQRLYRSAGFTACGPFGSYELNPHSLFMQLQLAGTAVHEPSQQARHTRMQILEFGSPTGIPVVFHFGTPQRGDAGAEFSALAASLNIRLICPTRPWYDDAESAMAFDEVTAPTLRYLRDQGITRAHAVGGSGGGPFALHLAQADPHTVADATLFASMGHPDSFARLVSSPPTVQLLSVFASRDHAQWMESCAAWGLPPDLAHGAWGDFVVFFDQTASLLKQHTHPVHVFQSVDDENAPIQSVRELLALATDVHWTIDARFGHLAIAQSDGVGQFHEILAAIVSRAAA